MYVFNSKINIGGYQLQGVNNLTINSSVDTLSDTASITLPGLEKQLGKQLKIGDPVEVYLGYDGEYNLEFSGYIDTISPNVPLTLTCEDEMWKLKRIPIPKATGDAINKLIAKLGVGFEQWLTRLNSLLNVGDMNVTAPGFSIGNHFRVEVGSVARLLQKLRDQYGLKIYFRGKSLYVGLPFQEFATQKPVVYDLQRNVVSDNITDKTLDEVKRLVKVVSVLDDYDLTTNIDIGSQADVPAVVYLSKLNSEGGMVPLGKELLRQLKYGPFFSSITAFGLPFVQHSQPIKIIDNAYQVNGTGRREAVYFIEQVQTTVSKTGGFRRQITLGRFVDDLIENVDVLTSLPGKIL